jgi:hypothetical protein
MYFCPDKIMSKKFFIVVFVFLVSITSGLETFEYFLRVLDDSATCWSRDFQCENSEEEKESTEKSELLKFKEDLYTHSSLSDSQLSSSNLHIDHKQSLFSSDFRQEIYFPPELA